MPGCTVAGVGALGDGMSMRVELAVGAEHLLGRGHVPDRERRAGEAVAVAERRRAR